MCIRDLPVIMLLHQRFTECASCHKAELKDSMRVLTRIWCLVLTPAILIADKATLATSHSQIACGAAVGAESVSSNAGRQGVAQAESIG